MEERQTTFDMISPTGGTILRQLPKRKADQLLEYGWKPYAEPEAEEPKAEPEAEEEKPKPKAARAPRRNTAGQAGKQPEKKTEQEEV